MKNKKDMIVNNEGRKAVVVEKAKKDQKCDFTLKGRPLNSNEFGKTIKSMDKLDSLLIKANDKNVESSSVLIDKIKTMVLENKDINDELINITELMGIVCLKECIEKIENVVEELSKSIGVPAEIILNKSLYTFGDLFNRGPFYVKDFMDILYSEELKNMTSEAVKNEISLHEEAEQNFANRMISFKSTNSSMKPSIIQDMDEIDVMNMSIQNSISSFENTGFTISEEEEIKNQMLNFKTPSEFQRALSEKYRQATSYKFECDGAFHKCDSCMGLSEDGICEITCDDMKSQNIRVCNDFEEK